MAGTLVSQTLLNLLALLLLAVVVVGSNDILRGREGVLILVEPAAARAHRGGADSAVAGGGEPARRLRRTAGGHARAHGAGRRCGAGASTQGPDCVPPPGPAAWATSAQLAAWGLQLMGAFALLLALELDHRAGLGAAAAVLFAVNVTAVLPARLRTWGCSRSPS